MIEAVMRAVGILVFLAPGVLLVPAGEYAHLTDWDSPEELLEFLAEDDTDRVTYLRANADGKIAFNGICEDLALRLRDRAMLVGKHLSIVPLHPAEFRKWQPIVESWAGKNPGPLEYHAINMARIGNEFWYIEPDTDRAWLALYLD